MNPVFATRPCLALGLGAAAGLLTAAGAAAQPIVIDAVFGGGPGFTVGSGNWIEDTTGVASNAFNGNQLTYLAPPGTDPGLVTWTFTGLDTSLTYDVAATWVPDQLAGNRSTDAMYTVNGLTSTGPLVVSQFDAPTADHTALDGNSDSFDFQTIASVMPNLDGIITLTLEDPTSGDINFERADAALVNLPGVLVLGDYNSDGSVTAADYTVWADTFGSTTDLRADGNGDGSITAADYTIWADNFGAGGAGSAVPEPGSLALLGLGGLAVLRRRR